MTPLCPINILDDLAKKVQCTKWENKEAQSYVISGINLAVAKLQKSGFIELNAAELATKPLKIKGNIDYGTLLS